MSRESKWYTRLNEKQKKAVLEEFRNKKDIRHMENKEQNDKRKTSIVNNHFKCKWIKRAN